MRIALGLEYAGLRYSGWQSQPARRTVQATLEAALSKIAGVPVATIVAGRTDAGVHASGQVVHFDVEADRPESAWTRGVNTFLPDDMSVRWARRVDPAFHARFSASARSYRYYLLNRPQRPGVLAGRVGWDFHPLDPVQIKAAAGLLVGEHDFSAFRAAECQARNPVRKMFQADVAIAGDYLIFDFKANAFLHHMIRNLVGSLVYVGKGAHSPQWITALLTARDRQQAAPTMMPDGLYLTGVDYAAHWGLPTDVHTIFPWEGA